MDLLVQILSILLISVFTLKICIYLSQMKKPYTYRRSSCSAPQAGGACPIIGHMHLLGSNQLTHKTLGAMADKYGPAFTIRLGSKQALVLSSREMARECFIIHDKVFSNRQTVAASKILGYDCAMFSFAPYGSYWREMRKTSTIELLSNYRLDMLKNVRASEVETAIKEVYQTWTTKSNAGNRVLVDMKQWFADLTHNIVLQMVVGKRFFGANAGMEEDEARKYQKVIRSFFDLFGVFTLSDAIPSLGWLDFNGYKKKMKETAKELDIVVGRWLEEHKQKRLSSGHDGKGDVDFMDVMLNKLGNEKIYGFDADTINKATCMNMILGGSDTTTVTLTWALSLLLNHQHDLKKAQEELDIHIGNDRNVEESDIKHLVYIQAIVKETLRLYPPSPVINLRQAMEDCVFSNGYHVPAGTWLIVNLWKIHRDERVWSDPDRFQPERFMNKHKGVEVRGQNLELIPFGAGRRSCPGTSMALQMVHLALARLLHCFDVSKPSSEPVDMTESSGLTNMKATPLEVLLAPRLASKLYEYTSTP